MATDEKKIHKKVEIDKQKDVDHFRESHKIQRSDLGREVFDSVEDNGKNDSDSTGSTGPRWKKDD
jgi:hypothetical protein